MKEYYKDNALEYLQALVGQPLSYGFKFFDTDLYDIGFGKLIEATNLRGKKRDVCSFVIHAMCRFEIIWKAGEHRVNKYYEDTPSEQFHSDIQRLIGLYVKRVALSDKNDLWLDLGDYWMVFATFENREESWRFFPMEDNSPHLVASDSWLCLDS